MKTSILILSAFLALPILSWAADVTPHAVVLRGANGQEVSVTVVSIQTYGIVAIRDGEKERVVIKWAQLDRDHLKANYPEIEQERADEVDREKNGVFAKNPKPRKSKTAYVVPDAPPVTLPMSMQLLTNEGKSLSVKVWAIYTEGMRVDVRGSTPSQQFLKWEDVDTDALYRSDPGFKKSRSLASPIVKPVEGRFVVVDAKWPSNFSATESRRKLNVVIRTTGKEKAEVKVEAFHVYRGSFGGSWCKDVVIEPSKPAVLEIELPVAEYGSKSQGDWAIRLWCDGQIIGIRSSISGLTKLPAGTREPDPNATVSL